MTDDASDRIRELQLKISQWGQEHDHSMNQQLREQAQRADTMFLTSRIALLGSIPSALLIVFCSVIAAPYEQQFSSIWKSIPALIVLAIFTAAAARVSGLLTHYWFRRSFIRERTAAIFISLAAAVLLFWWTLFLTNILWPLFSIF